MSRALSALLSALAALALATAVPGPARAADDPSIRGETRTGVQHAMSRFIEDRSRGGRMLHYDPVAGDLLELDLVELHSGIVKKGEFYVSCADFRDERGRLVDLDLLVLPEPDGYRVQQAIVHAVEGEERPYHVEE